LNFLEKNESEAGLNDGFMARMGVREEPVAGDLNKPSNPAPGEAKILDGLGEICGIQVRDGENRERRGDKR